MHAHGVTGDLGDILVGEGDLVAPVAGADQIAQLLRGVQAHLVQNLLHSQLSGDFGIDLAADGGVGADLAVLIQNDRLGISGTHITAAVVFHSRKLLYICSS